MRAAELNASAAGDGHHVPFAGCHPVLDILVAWVAIALAVGVFDGGEDRSQAPPSTPSVAVAAAAGACDACHTFGPRRPVVALALAAPSPAQRNR